MNRKTTRNRTWGRAGILALVCGLMLAAPVLADREDKERELFEQAQREMNRNSYEKAAELFFQVGSDFPDSKLAADALYWEAFARYRLGGESELRRAVAALENLRITYPEAQAQRDAEELLARLEGVLAEQGDSEAAARLYHRVQAITSELDDVYILGDDARVLRRDEMLADIHVLPDGDLGRSFVMSDGSPVMLVRGPDDEDDVRLAALNALMHMDEDKALPILRKTLARRGEGTERLRERALMILAQIGNEEAEDLLVEIVREDPDMEMRRAAVLWLANVSEDKAFEAVEAILAEEGAGELVENAVFVLSHHDTPRAQRLLREMALDESASRRARERAILGIGRYSDEEDFEFLRDMYGRLDDPELRKLVLLSVGHIDEPETAAWLMDVALNEDETVENRSNALFWAARSGEVDVARLASVYERAPGKSAADRRALREQILYLLAQDGGDEAVDKLIEIVRAEEDAKLRLKAVFWLGQLDDPRTVEVLEAIINQ